MRRYVLRALPELIAFGLVALLAVKPTAFVGLVGGLTMMMLYAAKYLPYILGAGFLIVVAVFVWRFVPHYPYQRYECLLTEAEGRFYEALNAAVGSQYKICPKVRMADLLCVVGPDPQHRAFWQIANKHIDFVLCDRQLRPLAAIELDDSSHQRRDRRQRDVFVDRAFARAGLPLFRWPVRSSYSVGELRQTLTGGNAQTA
jgi:hypothetical protein